MMRVWCSLIFVAVSAMGFSQTDETLRLLQSSDWAGAQKALVAAKTVHLPNLIEVVGSGTSQVRTRAAIALRLIDDESAVPALCNAFQKSSPKVRQEILWTVVNLQRHQDFGMHGEPYDLDKQAKPIIDLGKATVPHLIDWLGKPERQVDYRIKYVLVQALGDIGDARAVGPILRAMKSEAPMWVATCMEAAVKYDDPRVIPAIVERIDVEFSRDFSDTPGVWVLKKMPEKAFPHLVKGVKEHPRGTGRAWCIQTLKAIGDQRATPTVIEATSDPSAMARFYAFSFLFEFPTPLAEAATIRGLIDPDDQVRDIALSAAKVCGAKPTFGTLLGFLRDADASIRSEAVRALEDLGRSRVKNHLLTMLRNPDLCRDGILGIRILRLREADTVGSLIALIGRRAKDDPEICDRAVEALVEIGEPALAPLTEAAKDASSESLVYYNKALLQIRAKTTSTTSAPPQSA